MSGRKKRKREDKNPGFKYQKCRFMNIQWKEKRKMKRVVKYDPSTKSIETIASFIREVWYPLPKVFDSNVRNMDVTK